MKADKTAVEGADEGIPYFYAATHRDTAVAYFGKGRR
jgi:hypothetical protein